jgi:hypothetical protein
VWESNHRAYKYVAPFEPTNRVGHGIGLYTHRSDIIFSCDRTALFEVAVGHGRVKE